MKGFTFRLISLGLLLWGCVYAGPSAWGAEIYPQGFTYSARFFDVNSVALSSIVDLKFSIYNPAGNCLLYEEEQTGFDLAANHGLVSVLVGAGTRTTLDPSLTLAAIFVNSSAQVIGAYGGCPGYTPSTGDGRLLHVAVTPHTANPSNTWISYLFQETINAVPLAHSAETLQGFAPSSFLQSTDQTSSFTPTALHAIFGTGVSGVMDTALTYHHHDSFYLRKSAANTMTSGLTVQLGSNAVGFTVQGAAGQTSDLQQWKDNSGAVVAQLGSSGNLAVSGLSIGGNAVLATGSVLASNKVQWTTSGIIPPSKLACTAANAVVIFKSGGSGLSCSTLDTSDLPAPVGDVSGSFSATVVAKLRGKAISPSTPSHGEVLKYNVLAQQWEPAADLTEFTINTGPGLTGGPFTTSGTVSLAPVGGVSGAYVHANLSVDATGRVTSASSNIPVSLSSGATGTTGVLAFTGDVSGSASPSSAALSVVKLRGQAVVASAPSQGQFLQTVASSWTPASDPPVQAVQTTCTTSSAVNRSFSYSLTGGSCTIGISGTIVDGQTYVFSITTSGTTVAFNGSNFGFSSIYNAPYYRSVCTVPTTGTAVCAFVGRGGKLYEVR